MEHKDVSLYTADELENVSATTDEQEVAITAYRDDDRFSVWVTDNIMLTKMKAGMKASPNEYRLEQVSWHRDGTVAGYEFSIPKNFLTFRTKDRKREYTEEEKAKMREILAKARATKTEAGK